MDYSEEKLAKEKLEVEMGPILKFFLERDLDELSNLSGDLSDEADEFFDNSLTALLGTMPDEVADVVITTHKSSLKQMLYSALITGYMTKTVEDRLNLEKLWQGPDPEKQDDVLLDNH